VLSAMLLLVLEHRSFLGESAFRPRWVLWRAGGMCSTWCALQWAVGDRLLSFSLLAFAPRLGTLRER
jgi:hypothetical protein